MNNFNDFDERQSDSMPVFFTGLSEGVKQEPKRSLLCILCKSIITNNTNGTQNSNVCENCAKLFNNLKEALSHLSNSSFPVPQTPCTQTSQISVPHREISKTSLQSQQISVPPDRTFVSPQQVITSPPEISDNYEHDYRHNKRKSLLPHPDQPSTSNDMGFTPPMEKTMRYGRKQDRNSFSPNHTSDSKRKSNFHQNNSKRPRTSFSPDTTHHSRDRSFSEIFDDELSKSIWQLFEENKQSQAVYDRKMALRDKLHEMLLTTFPSCGLYVVGSSMTGLGGDSSDMDMCLMLTDAEIDQEKEATNILHTVHSLFLDCKFLTGVEVIYAKVPILRFTDSVSGIEVDLNVNNAVGIRNTQLLSSYARMDKRLPPLVLLVKMWARCNGINDAKNNTLSSYSLVLMVIHYLQYGCQPPVLPCLQKLQPGKYHPNSNVRKLKLLEDLPSFTSKNQNNLGDLFIGFLNYFANEFDYYRSVMSVRLGGILPKEVAMNNNSPKNKKGHWKWVCIEEPFNLTNTACAVFKPGVFSYLKQVFVDSWNMLRRTADLSSIMN